MPSSAEFTYTPSTADDGHFAVGVSDIALSFPLFQTDIPDGLTQRIAHRIVISNGTPTDHSGKTLTVVGTDEEGKPLTETLAAPGIPTPAVAVAITLGYFKTVTSVTISATIGADFFDIGFIDEFVSAPYPLDIFFSRTAVGTAITGTINYDIEFTFSKLFTDDKANWRWKTATAIQAQIVDIAEAFEKNIYGIRFKANSYSAGATARFEIIQTFN